jgi:UDP-N-acetylglucosamine 2-epimerase (non-hydrolysing)
MGIKVGHIEAGMRSHDRRMFEEINRTVCDHCSDFLFTYHNNYAENLKRENIINGVYVVGNTILEVAKEIYDTRLVNKEKTNAHILVDIHRPENFQDKRRLKMILKYANFYSKHYNIPAYILNFSRTMQAIKDFDLSLGFVGVKDQMGFLEYLDFAYNAKLAISDSGTAPEELPILKTPVLVPRDYTERPEAYAHSCAVELPLVRFNTVLAEVTGEKASLLTFDTSWLGDGNTSSKIIKILKDNL